MELSNNNLYVDARIYSLGNGEELMIREPLTWKIQSTDKIHVVKIGESLDQIAHQYYNKKRNNPEKYWWLIAEANNIQNPLDIEYLVGKSITIPDVLLLDFVRK